MTIIHHHQAAEIHSEISTECHLKIFRKTIIPEKNHFLQQTRISFLLKIRIVYEGFYIILRHSVLDIKIYYNF